MKPASARRGLAVAVAEVVTAVAAAVVVMEEVAAAMAAVEAAVDGAVVAMAAEAAMADTAAAAMAVIGATKNPRQSLLAETKFEALGTLPRASAFGTDAVALL